LQTEMRDQTLDLSSSYRPKDGTKLFVQDWERPPLLFSCRLDVQSSVGEYSAALIAKGSLHAPRSRGHGRSEMQATDMTRHAGPRWAAISNKKADLRDVTIGPIRGDRSRRSHLARPGSERIAKLVLRGRWTPFWCRRRQSGRGRKPPSDADNAGVAADFPKMDGRQNRGRRSSCRHTRHHRRPGPGNEDEMWVPVETGAAKTQEPSP